jgi:hypothetical protein
VSDTVVPYARFLEVRKRRQRVVVELTHETVATGLDSDPPGPSVSAVDGKGPVSQPSNTLMEDGEVRDLVEHWPQQAAAKISATLFLREEFFE